jgi:hypothetical protein
MDSVDSVELCAHKRDEVKVELSVGLFYLFGWSNTEPYATDEVYFGAHHEKNHRLLLADCGSSGEREREREIWSLIQHGSKVEEEEDDDDDREVEQANGRQCRNKVVRAGTELSDDGGAPNKKKKSFAEISRNFLL